MPKATKKMYVVHSIKLVNYLCRKGFTLLKVEDSYGYAAYKVFLFDDTKALRDVVDTWITRG